MGTLSQALNSIPLNQRRAALEDLVSNGLQSQDIRFLIERLKTETGRFVKDICAYPKLPIEIIMHIAKHLPLDDILKTRLVSKLWSTKFFGEEVLLYLIKIHFRTTWERDYTPLGEDDVEQRLLVRTRFMSWFPEQAQRRIRWERGRNRQRLLPISPVDPGVPPEEQRQYSNGRIAFNIGSGIVVQSLNATFPSLTFRDKDRQKLGKWYLSDQLLVAKKASELVVYAWLLPVVTLAMNNTPETIPGETIRTPSDVRHISANRHQIGLILTGSEIMIWQLGGGTKLIDTSKINAKSSQHKPSAFALFFHPVNHDHFFVFYQCEIDSHRRRIVVLEVQGDGAQQLIPLEDPFREDDYAMGAPGSPSKVSTTARAIDADGLCVISCETELPETAQRTYRLLTFNLYEKRFGFYPPLHSTATLRLKNGLESTLAAEIHEYVVCISQALIWRNSLLIPASPTSQAFPKHSIIEGSILIRLCPYDNMDSHTWVAWNDIDERKGASGKRVSPSEEQWNSWTLPPIVRGDDDYVVLFGDRSAIVWQFDAETRKNTTEG